MADYKPVSGHSYRPAPKRHLSSEDRFWRSFKPLQPHPHSSLIDEASLQNLKRVNALFNSETLPQSQTQSPYHLTGAVHSISICRSAPFDLAVTAGTRVHCYHGGSGALKKTFSRFKGKAYSGALRSEGSLLVAGCENGHVSVFNVATGALMRVFKGHRKGVQVTKWSADRGSVLSCSDDRTLRQWDVATEKQVFAVDAHEDYIRCAEVVGPGQAVTGGYDGVVKIWDLRQPERATVRLEHGKPVESVVALQGGSLVCSAAGNEVKVWDVLGGGRLLHSFAYHAKAVMDMSVDGTGTRLLTSGLDQHVKVVDLKTFACVSQIKETAGVMAVRTNAENSKVVTGLVSGEVVIRQRKKSGARKEGTAVETGERPPRAGSFRYFMRGANAGPSAGDVLVKRNKKRKLQPYDRHLRKFEYKQALDAALQTRQPYMVATLLDELRQRSGLGKRL